jgi:hypothetical protein
MNAELLGEGIDPEDLKSENKSIDAAYIASGKKTLWGSEIHGWSGRRRAATFEIGFSGSGSVLDPIRVVYCCIVDPIEITAIFRSPTIAIEKFLRWAEENKCIDPTEDKWEEAFKVAEDILEESERSQFQTPDDNSPESQVSGNSTGHQE